MKLASPWWDIDTCAEIHAKYASNLLIKICTTMLGVRGLGCEWNSHCKQTVWLPRLMALGRLIYLGFLKKMLAPPSSYLYILYHIFHIFFDLKLMVDKRGAPKAPPTHYPISFRSKKKIKNIQKYIKMGGAKFSENPRYINLTRTINLGNQTVWLPR